jgi:hypothetical protein
VAIQLGGASSRVQLVGIDRVDFPTAIGRFDRDWGGGQPIGALMNLLARNADGVLVTRDLLAKGLKIGDPLSPAALRDDVRSIFGLGFFDDDDLCLRARRAGFSLAVALDCYVHHFGSQTFRAMGVDAVATNDPSAAIPVRDRFRSG